MSTTVDVVEDTDDALGLPGSMEGECKGVMWPLPAVFPDSSSKALNARDVEREREQPRKT